MDCGLYLKLGIVKWIISWGMFTENCELGRLNLELGNVNCGFVELLFLLALSNNGCIKNN
jgi:hypothetical protein